MLGELLAYFYGKSAGRDEERRRHRPKRLTPDDLAYQRILCWVVIFCVILVVVAQLFGHS